jgi:hypothetical protein
MRYGALNADILRRKYKELQRKSRGSPRGIKISLSPALRPSSLSSPGNNLSTRFHLVMEVVIIRLKVLIFLLNRNLSASAEDGKISATMRIQSTSNILGRLLTDIFEKL